MKEIIHNEDSISMVDINKVVKRAKILFLDSKDRFLLATVNNDIHIVGGHVENNETDEEAIKREVREETGVSIDISLKKPVVCIKYFCKDFPKLNTNTLFIANYYLVNMDIVPDLDNTALEEGEKAGNFNLFYINKNDAIDYIKKSLKNCTNKNVALDTIDVIKECLHE